MRGEIREERLGDGGRRAEFVGLCAQTAKHFFFFFFTVQQCCGGARATWGLLWVSDFGFVVCMCCSTK